MSTEKKAPTIEESLGIKGAEEFTSVIGKLKQNYNGIEGLTASKLDTTISTFTTQERLAIIMAGCNVINPLELVTICFETEKTSDALIALEKFISNDNFRFMLMSTVERIASEFEKEVLYAH